MDYPEFDPTALFAGEGNYRSRPITVAQASAVTARGTVLGRVGVTTGTGALTVAATAGNTGNGVVTPDAAAPVQLHAKTGVYLVKFTAANAFSVIDPNGVELQPGATGAVYNDEIKFAIAAGATAFAAGDSFGLTVSPSDIYVPCVATATDGSQVPAAIMADWIDTTGGAVIGPAYFDGTFTAEMLTFDPSWTIQTLRAALRQANSLIDIRSAGVLG